MYRNKNIQKTLKKFHVRSESSEGNSGVILELSSQFLCRSRNLEDLNMLWQNAPSLLACLTETGEKRETTPTVILRYHHCQFYNNKSRSSI